MKQLLGALVVVLPSTPAHGDGSSDSSVATEGLALIASSGRSRPSLPAAPSVIALTLATAGLTLGPPVDPSHDRVAPGFRGHAFSLVFRLFDKRKLGEKGEFETTDAYQKRIASAGSTAHYAFQLPAVFDYNAEAERFEIEVPVDKIRDEFGASGLIWLASFTQRTVGSHVAGNAFGAKVHVERIHTDEAGIRTAKLRGVERDGNTVHLEIPMSLALAKAVKPTLGLLLVCAPTAAADGRYTSSGTDLEEATIGHPVEVTYSFKYISCGPPSLWAYDTKTGAVHHKLTFDDQGKGLRP